MPRILFVEDDPFIAEIYKKKFASSGFDALNVMTGKAALKEALEQKFDLMLLDLVIPELSGMDVLREIRKNPSYDPNLKIVVFSNLSSQEDRDECLRLGANGFISKTEFSPSEVVDEVNRFLTQFQEQSKNAERFEKKNSLEPEGKEDPIHKEAKRILFVEDEPFFVDMFGKRLKDEGYDVTTCLDGASGLQKALDETFDLVISDVVMPKLDGRELVQKLKEAESENNTPIFLFSASLDDKDVKELIDSKIADRVFLKTEITPTELVSIVNAFFKEREA